MSSVEAWQLSASVEAEWMRDPEKYPKILTSRRRGGLFKHQNNSFFDLERDHLVCGNMVAIAPFFLCRSHSSSTELCMSQNFFTGHSELVFVDWARCKSAGRNSAKRR